MDPKGKAYGINKSAISGLIFKVQKHKENMKKKKKIKHIHKPSLKNLSGICYRKI